jgi:hypothetical protein
VVLVNIINIIIVPIISSNNSGLDETEIWPIIMLMLTIIARMSGD